MPESREVVVAESRATPLSINARRSKAAMAFRSVADQLVAGCTTIEPLGSRPEHAEGLARA